MSSGISDFGENKFLAHSFGKTAWTMPTAYIALYTVSPTDSGGGTEVTGGSYVRFTSSGATWITPVSGSISNAIDIVFATATASWGNIVGVGIHDGITGGNLIWWGDLSAAKTVDINEQFKFLVGQLVATLT